MEELYRHLLVGGALAAAGTVMAVRAKRYPFRILGSGLALVGGIIVGHVC